jgi:DMSO/TMAO reductase YedYZ molybdopterin-dependent catalytic subunit
MRLARPARTLSRVSTTDRSHAAAPRPDRVQRLVDRLPVVHLEADVPRPRAGWTLRVEGLVQRPLELSLEDLRRLPRGDRTMDLHCVWGWSRRSCRWGGVGLDTLFDLAGADPRATVATVAAIEGPYASCLHLSDARAGVLAWELDAEPLPPQHGGPLRFVQPAWLWGYKGVKWAARITLADRFVPGFWEAKTGDAEGRVPSEVLSPFERAAPG